jgi:hypothetical protein
MIETPTARNLEPFPTMIPDLEAAEPLRFALTDITFEDERLWQPRYESLIDYSRVALPGQARIEPSFQLREKTGSLQEITLELASEGFRFRTREGGEEVVAYSIAEPDASPLPGLVEIRLDGSERRCKLVWDTAAATAHATTLRIACDGGRARTPLEKKLAAVEGGLWLTLVKPSAAQISEPCPPPSDRGSRPDLVIDLLGFDDHGRPLYALFRGEAYRDIPGAIELEPAFRVGRGSSLPFAVALGSSLPPELHFRPNCGPGPDQIRVFPFQPQRREELERLAPTLCQARGRRCAMHWHRPPGSSHGTVGSVAAWFLALEFEPGAEVPERYRSQVLADGRTHATTLDPTVIQPPPCDPLTQTCLP